MRGSILLFHKVVALDLGRVLVLSLIVNAIEPLPIPWCYPKGLNIHTWAQDRTRTSNF